MNRDQANRLVRETFTAAFDKNRFLILTRELVNHLDESKAGAWKGNYVKDAFKEHVSYYERLGTYTSPQDEKLDVLVVHLTHNSKLERARTAMRNFVADHLKTRYEKDAALVAFVSPTEKQWRFSYVKMEYTTTQSETGRVGVGAKLTPARRFSYIVGAGESCHTAQARFLDLLQVTETDPTLADIEEAFSVEAVTKEFFNRYFKLFEELYKHLDKLVEEDKTIREDFKAKSISTVDFAKKLLGQIVFLYFLQKKGWLGVAKDADWGTGPRDFMRLLAAGKFGRYENFFNDILEPLFYDSLATDRGPEAWCKRFKCRIPFLNGGLFEPIGNYDWQKTDIVIPNQLFTNDERVDEGVVGTGVFDVFDRYNFTVNEAEPLEKEVAIDPEMLGKVFENLIEENRRKGLGAFYTPREIVHYMCQESLINYLDTAVNTREESMVPEKPQQDKMFEPPDPHQAALKMTAHKEAVPRDDLETFVHLGEQISHYESVPAEYKIKMPKSIEKNAPLLDQKLADITVCDPAVGSGAFPVGMMTEIVRARLALTPYLDERDRTSYHFKRHAIRNSLYGVDIDAGAVEIAKLRLWLSLVVDEEDVKEIKPLPNLDYKIVVGNSLTGIAKTLFNLEQFKRLEELKPLYFDATDRRKAQYKREIDAVIHELTSGKQEFDFEIYFSEVFTKKKGFDVVIANPPYVRQEQISEFKPALKLQFKCYTGTADLYVYFYERGFQILGENGVLTYISSDKYFRSAYGERLRAFLTNQMTIDQLIDFGDAPVFEAMAYPSIIVARKAKSDSNKIRVLNWELGKSIERFEAIFRTKNFFVSQKELTADGWRLESSAVLRLLEKLRRAGRPLGKYVNGRMYRGIVTGLNEAFVVDRVTRDRLVAEHRSSAEILKPFLRGRDIKRWAIDKPDLYLCYVGWELQIKQYPAVYNHLKQFEKDLKARPEVQEGRFPWYALSRYASDYWQEFEQDQIVWGNLATQPKFAFAEAGFYINAPACLLVSDSKYLLGILNSRVMHYLVAQSAAERQGGFFEYKPMYISPLAVPEQPKENRIASLVDRILTVKRTRPDADVAALEREIDVLVYELYGLTQEEIKIVEDSG